jgi:hypothetical protein
MSDSTSDSPGNLERELLAMRPRALRSETVNALSKSMSHGPSPFSDWCLVGAMGSGIAAVLVIIATLLASVAAPTARPTAAAPVIQPVPERAGDSLMMFARADNGVGGILK